ncbi:MAG: hypothetical protein ACE5FW_01840 [Candidatus Aenigmatarchaeota archaeon]
MDEPNNDLSDRNSYRVLVFQDMGGKYIDTFAPGQETLMHPNHKLVEGKATADSEEFVQIVNQLGKKYDIK